MRKTSVYMTEEEVECLKRASLATGRSQSELIRDGVRQVLVLVAEGIERRKFKSLGKGRSGGVPYARWEPDDLYAKVMGRR